jgi:predicted RecB family endonuclease
MTVKCDGCMKRFDSQDSLDRHRARTHDSVHNHVRDDVAERLRKSKNIEVAAERGIHIPDAERRTQRTRRADVMARENGRSVAIEVKAKEYGTHRVEGQLSDYVLAGHEPVVVIPGSWIEEDSAVRQSRIEEWGEISTVATFEETENGYEYEIILGSDTIFGSIERIAESIPNPTDHTIMDMLHEGRVSPSFVASIFIQRGNPGLQAGRESRNSRDATAGIGSFRTPRPVTIPVGRRRQNSRRRWFSWLRNHRKSRQGKRTERGYSRHRSRWDHATVLCRDGQTVTLPLESDAMNATRPRRTS